MSATDINEGPRSRAAELADNLADQVLRVIAAHPGISVSALRRELEPLDEEKRALLHLADLQPHQQQEARAHSEA